MILRKYLLIQLRNWRMRKYFPLHKGSSLACFRRFFVDWAGCWTREDPPALAAPLFLSFCVAIAAW